MRQKKTKLSINFVTVRYNAVQFDHQCCANQKVSSHVQYINKLTEAEVMCKQMINFYDGKGHYAYMNVDNGGFPELHNHCITNVLLVFFKIKPKRKRFCI